MAATNGYNKQQLPMIWLSEDGERWLRSDSSQRKSATCSSEWTSSAIVNAVCSPFHNTPSNSTDLYRNKSFHFSNCSCQANNRLTVYIVLQSAFNSIRFFSDSCQAHKYIDCRKRVLDTAAASTDICCIPYMSACH
jgi:hypothetical protein